jgi:hypothetical protein
LQRLQARVFVISFGVPYDYVAALREAGFNSFAIENRQGALLEMVNQVRRKLMGVQLAANLGKLDGSTKLAKVLGDLDLDEGKRLARRAVELIESGVAGYTLIAAVKGPG